METNPSESTYPSKKKRRLIIQKKNRGTSKDTLTKSPRANRHNQKLSGKFVPTNDIVTKGTREQIKDGEG